MVLIQLLLPAHIDDAGQRRSMHDALRSSYHELADRFDGVTAYVRAPAKGLWTADDGRTEQDDVVMVEVVATSFDRDWWQPYAATLARRFQQDAIHVRALAIETLEGSV
jgi:hypothetical protein